MGVFKKKREVTDKDVKEFVQVMGEENKPRFHKREELKNLPRKSAEAYWDRLADTNGPSNIKSQSNALAAAREEDGREEDFAVEPFEDFPLSDVSEELLSGRKKKDSGKKTSKLVRLRPSEYRNFLSERCEMIMDSKQETEKIRVEYEELTAYLTDIQKVERIQMEDRSELDEAARRILALEKERERLRNRKLPLTDYQLKLLERYEQVIPQDIKRIQEQEQYSLLIKEDMRQLEGEKGSILYEQEGLLEKQSFLKKIGIITGVMIVLLFALYTALMLNSKGNFLIPFMLTAFCGAIMAAYIFLESRRITSRMKFTEKKWNRAVRLQNKVKVKYINNTAALDYAYHKYAMNHSRELIYRWQMFVKAKDENASYLRNTELLRFYHETLVSELARYQVHDPQVWIYQAEALLDSKEMTEVRHRLNVRRQKLRDQLDYNNKVREDAEEEIRQFRQQYPDEKRRADLLLDTYGLSL